MIAEGIYTSSDIYYVIDISKSIILSGGWDTDFTSQIGFSTIDGENSRTGVNISTGITVVLENFIIQHAGNNAIQRGGIANDGVLTISNCVISENFTAYTGGGISNYDSVTINNSIVSGNFGHGIYSNGYLELNNSTVASNTQGGIENAGTALINSSQIHHNQVGSGISNSGILTLNNSSLYNNNGIYTGGGLLNQGTADINNSTISNNNSGGGGGIYNYGTISLNNSTVTGNEAFLGGGIYQDQYPIGAFTIQNTILANNTAIDTGADCYKQITSNGYNLVGTTTGCIITSKPGDKFNINPLLGTFLPGAGYHPLTPGSPAIRRG